MPLAVKQLLDINEDTIENESDWRYDSPKTNANAVFEESNLETKSPFVAVQQLVYPENEVGCVFACNSMCMKYMFACS